ncbi:hypothetical protein CR513_10702, partial [Mucuna pruriens]
MFTIEYESTKRSQDQEGTEVISAERTSVKADLHEHVQAEIISAKEDQKQARAESILAKQGKNHVPFESDFSPKAEIMSAHLVSSSIQVGQPDSKEDKLLQVLRQHKKANGWKISDLLGINPSICMHRILTEEEAESIRQQQRRMNLTIQDVVKKEVTKLLAAGIIYPISDSQWVSLVQVVPKKSGMTVMKNQHDELECNRDQNSENTYIIGNEIQTQGLDLVTPSSTIIAMVDGDDPPLLARTLRIKSTRLHW